MTLPGKEIDRREFLAGLGMLGIGCLPFLGACSRAETVSGSSGTERKAADMTIPARSEERKRPVPPIDASSPESVETATFGLG